MVKTLSDIAVALNGELIGDPDQQIHSIAGIEEATSGQLSFVANPKYAKFITTTSASALIVGKDFMIERSDISYIRVADPYRGFVMALRAFAPVLDKPQQGVHSSAVIGEGVQLGEGVSIGPYVVIGNDCSIGSGSVLMAGAFIGERTILGSDCFLHPNVTIYRDTVIGNNVTVNSGVVIGADGFGFLRNSDGQWESIPQTGIVVIEDNVDIGANTTIDRATLGETRICRGVKLDNQIHIAHNVCLGENTVIAAQTGIAGSSRIGSGNMIAGQVGIVGHIETVENVIIEPQSGVSKSLRKPGRYFGHPAKEHELALRQEAAMRQLPDMLMEIRELKNRLDQLEPQQ